MNFEELLKGRVCSCGMNHTCAIKHIIIGRGANEKLGGLLDDYRKILLVADTNTYAACGDAIRAQIGDKLESLLVYERDGLLIPDEEAVGEMQKKLTAQTDLIVGIGSGVIQDTCKYVSHMAGLPYAIVATAPSMDGYASVGAAMIMGGMKVTYSAHVPEMIIGDIDVLKDAPMEMIKSGYGDILGKYSCLNDWKLARIVRGEYFCPYVYDLTMDMVVKTRDLGEKLLARDPDAIQTLMEAIVGVGVCMSLVGNSRPASGSEHHLSHYFEIVGIERNEEYLPHGIDVCFSAIETACLREKLLALPSLDGFTYSFDKEKYEAEIRRIYGGVADEVLALQKKLGWYELDRVRVYREKWDEIKKILADAPTADEMEALASRVGLNKREFDGLYGQKKIEDARLYAKDLKDRYTVLWMYYDLFGQK